MKNIASKYHKEGFSCSQSITKAAIDKGYCTQELYNAACAFSGGISSQCICGAVAASLMVLGCIAKDNNSREIAKEFVESFKAKHKATCCRVLSANLTGIDKRNNCNKLVEDCADILEKIVKERSL